MLTRTPIFAAILAAVPIAVLGLAQQSVQSQSSPTSECAVIGSARIEIACEYQADPASTAEPKIVLNKASISFDTRHDNVLRVELTFTNARKSPVTGEHPVYLAFDDAGGKNHLRRLLHQVDFRRLKPGEPLAFTERQRAPAFEPTVYFVRLWIPSPDPALQFDSSHNLLLANIEIPDAKTRLNNIAKFTVTR